MGCLMKAGQPGNRLHLFLAALLFAIGLAIRLTALTGPIDSTSTLRTTMGAIVARGMYYQMLPDADPVLKAEAISIWKAESLYEPKIFERLVAVAYLVTGGEHLWLHRLFGILFWMLGAAALYDLARRTAGPWGALISLAIFLLVPIGVSASRWFQPDGLMVMMVLVTANCAWRWSMKPTLGRSVLLGAAAGLAILVKIQSIFPVLGLTLGLILATYGLRRFLFIRNTWVIGGLMSAFPAAYYLAGIAERSSGYFSFWTLSMLGLLKEGFMYAGWTTILNQLYGFVLLCLGIIGVLLSRSRMRALLVGGWLGYIIFGLTFPYQIHTHAYYSLVVLPLLSLSVAPVGSLIGRQMMKLTSAWRPIAAALVLIAVIYVSWLDRVQVLGSLTAENTRAWEIMGDELPRDGKIIALTHDYGNFLAYYGFRKVDLWPYTEDFQVGNLSGAPDKEDFPVLFSRLTQGYRYFLVTQFAQLDAQADLKKMLNEHYALVKDGDGFILYDLAQRK